jgi:hypothetical protein
VTLLPKELALKLPGWLLSGGMGAGAAIAYVLAEREPRALIETFQHWGPWSLMGLVAMVIASRVGERVMDLGERAIQAVTNSAASQQQLADAVNAIAKKDDQEAYEQRVLMGHIGTQTEKILTRFDELERRMNDADRAKQQARGASA